MPIPQQPLFTIATITYNSSQWVRDAIESILASRYTEFEYVISDDCSTDNTWAIIQEYKDPRIVAWRNEKNLGEYPNRQKVLEHARGKYILYIDGDDILYRDTLQRYFWYLEAFPQTKAIWGIEYLSNTGIVFPYIMDSKSILKLNYFHNSLICFIGFPESLFGVNALKQIGGLNTKFDIGDTYIKKKFACLYDVVVIPLGMAYWRQHENQASKQKTKKYSGFIQNYQIDSEILNAEYNPLSPEDLRIAKKNWKVRTMKLLVSKTILKGRFLDFFKLKSKLSIPISDMQYLFIKANSETHKINKEEPMKNEYNYLKQV